MWPELKSAHQNNLIEHDKRIYVAADQAPPSAYAGVLAVLDQLKAAGIQLAVATGKSRRGLDRVMALTKTENYFVATRCADEALSKPHPLMLEQLLNELDTLPENAIMRGDTENDLEMATNAGMKSVGVTYGAHHEDRLKACKPHAIIDHFTQLPTLLGL